MSDKNREGQVLAMSAAARILAFLDTLNEHPGIVADALMRCLVSATIGMREEFASLSPARSPLEAYDSLVADHRRAVVAWMKHGQTT